MSVIEFKSPHSLNMEEDFEYVDTFIKGKNGHNNVENIRLLLRGVKTGEEGLFFLQKKDNFFGQDRYSIEHINLKYCKKITNDHYKFKSYNYYRNGVNPLDVDSVFSAWINSDPMVHVGGYQHQFVSTINRYQGSYKFNNKTY